MGFTTKQIYDLNHAMVANQNVNLGTIVSGLVDDVDAQPVLYRESIVADLGTAVYVHAAVLLTDEAQEVTTAITNPDVPRILSVKGNDGNVTGDVVIAGTNVDDEAITETIALNGSTEVFGTKAFKTVTSITLPVYAVAGTENVSIGVGDSVGFARVIAKAGMILSALFDGSDDDGSASVGATVELCLWDVDGTLNGTKVLDFLYYAI